MFDFARPDWTEKLGKRLSGLVTDPEKALFEWFILDGVLIWYMVDDWLAAHGPAVRSRVASELWSQLATYLVETFSRFVNEACYKQIIGARIRAYSRAFVEGQQHHDGPGWTLGKAYAEALGEADNLVVVLEGTTLSMSKVRSLRGALDTMETYEIVST